MEEEEVVLVVEEWEEVQEQGVGTASLDEKQRVPRLEEEEINYTVVAKKLLVTIRDTWKARQRI